MILSRRHGNQRLLALASLVPVFIFSFVNCTRESSGGGEARQARGASSVSQALSFDPNDPIPSDRRIDWSVTGVPGGIPNRTKICATFSPGATASAINNAISACDNGVVQLNAGTYTSSSLGGPIRLDSNVTLRGAGANKTIIAGPYQLEMHSAGAIPLGTNITGGATKGSTSITVASTANLFVGGMIEISRLDDKALIPMFGSWSPSNGRSIVQVNVVTAINGNTLTLRNPAAL